MLRMLHDEGFTIKERELMRVRAKNRWLLRVPNGTKTTPTARALEVPELSEELDLDMDVQDGDEHGMRELERAMLVSGTLRVALPF